jgi:hypothetical protein
MTLVFVKKVQTLYDPRIEAAADVLGDFLHDVAAVLEPLKFRARRYREDGLFAFFAVIPELHRESIPGRWAKTFASKKTPACAGVSVAGGRLDFHARFDKDAER